MNRDDMIEKITTNESDINHVKETIVNMDKKVDTLIYKLGGVNIVTLVVGVAVTGIVSKIL